MPHCALSLLQIHGARVKVDSVAKVGEIEKAEREKMKTKVQKILKHNIKYVFWPAARGGCS